MPKTSSCMARPERSGRTQGHASFGDVILALSEHHDLFLGRNDFRGVFMIYRSGKSR